MVITFGNFGRIIQCQKRLCILLLLGKNVRLLLILAIFRVDKITFLYFKLTFSLRY